MDYEESSRNFSQIRKKYILDLGYHDAGDTLSLESENGENLNLTAYRVNEPALARLISLLNQQTLVVDSYDETSLNGHIFVTSAGQLVLSVPYDPGWTLYVDGARTDMNLFEDTFIGTYLDEGAHTIELRYFPKGFIPGIIVSLVCIMLTAALYYISLLYRRRANA